MQSAHFTNYPLGSQGIGQGRSRSALDSSTMWSSHDADTKMHKSSHRQARCLCNISLGAVVPFLPFFFAEVALQNQFFGGGCWGIKFCIFIKWHPYWLFAGSCSPMGWWILAKNGCPTCLESRCKGNSHSPFNLHPPHSPSRLSTSLRLCLIHSALSSIDPPSFCNWSATLPHCQNPFLRSDHAEPLIPPSPSFRITIRSTTIINSLLYTSPFVPPPYGLLYIIYSLFYIINHAHTVCITPVCMYIGI